MRILLIGWFGAGNIGDEAILISELLFLREQIAGVEFHVLSFDAARTEKLTAEIPEVKKIIQFQVKRRVFRSDFWGLLRSLREADRVLIGGGGLFQDIYNYYPIPFFTAMALLARCFGKPAALFCVGIGPIRVPVNKVLCRWAANAARLVSVRDTESADLLKQLGVTRAISVSADPVFLLEPADAPADCLQILGIDERKPQVGVCVQDLLSWSDSSRQALAETLDIAVDRWGAQIVFIPFGAYRDGWLNGTQSDPVDVRASKRIASMMRRESFIAPTGEWSPQELLAVMGKMSLVVSMRFHGLVMAVNSGAPVIALTHQAESKLKNLMKALGRQDHLLEVADLDKQKLLHLVEDLMSRGSGRRNELQTMVRSFRSTARECDATVVQALLEAKTT